MARVSRKAIASGMLGLLCAALLLALALRHGPQLAHLPERALTRWLPPRAPRARQLRAPERRAFQALARTFRGRVVWSSNRAGNHELYLVDTRTGRPVSRRLTDDPRVEFGAAFSPDGRWLAFARSRREWVSFREEDAWDVYVMRADGGDERLVAEFGYRPVWGPEGRSLLFERAGRLIEADLASGREQVLFDGATELGGRAWGDPALHPSRRLLALSVAGYGAIVRTPGGVRRLTDEQVCQTVWLPGDDELLWVEPTGNGGTRIVRGAADGSRRSVLMDLPGERSHEYFPAPSNDGRWLFWGAAAEGHEHDRADYEIYAWRIGRPWGEAVRLTFYRGNDQWPAAFVQEDAGPPSRSGAAPRR